uniref:Uncharacterized protein n=1 Tax=Arundo donax TaxID=35708 RepID=A0A0A8YTY7_ARUDO
MNLKPKRTAPCWRSGPVISTHYLVIPVGLILLTNNQNAVLLLWSNSKTVVIWHLFIFPTFCFLVPMAIF